MVAGKRTMLTKTSIELLKGVLAAASRTTMKANRKLSHRYVELTPGMVPTLMAPVNSLVTGRRGVGKSTTLALLQREAEKKGHAVVFIDAETYKERDYPDVVIEILLEIVDKVCPRVWLVWGMRARVHLKRIQRALVDLLQAPNVVRQSLTVKSEDDRETGIQLRGGAARRYLRLTGQVGRVHKKTSTFHAKSTRTRTKEDILRDFSPALACALDRSTGARCRGFLFLIIDDFYFIEKRAQPFVLDHLHGITKRSRVWLKIGSVHSRTRSFADGDPPVGMQPPNDLQHVSLDLGLSEYATAKGFLEQVADGVLEPIGLSIGGALTDTARSRAVQVAGGAVVRDYFDLVVGAADAAWESAQKKGRAQAKFRIGAEDIQEAAKTIAERKIVDLRNDTGRDAPGLEERFRDIIGFVRERDSFYFSVRREDLDAHWGRQIAELQDLRFVHKIMVTRPNTGSMRKRDVIVFMVDISALIDRRMQKAPVEFWKPRQSDLLRKASLVYSPGWLPSERGRKRRVTPRDRAFS